MAYAVCRWCSNKKYISHPVCRVIIHACHWKGILLVTSVSIWCQTPLVLPAVTRSDHESILFQPVEDPRRPPKSVIGRPTYRRITSHNRRALLFNHLQQHKWSHFLSPELLARHIWLFLFIYSVFVKLCMPVIRSSVNNLDKPWVTPEFRYLVKQHQRALISSQNHFIVGWVIRCNAWRLLSVNMTIDRVKWRHISMVAIRSPFCRSAPSYCA